MTQATSSNSRFMNGPVQSLFRYFPFETLTWRKTIARSGLPVEVQDLIRTVVQKSRLWRFEKIEVVQELISHFADGELAGHSSRQLIDQFGDPQIAAKLIRRSKTRNRPIMFRAFQFMGWALLAALSFYFLMSGYYYSGSPQPRIDYLAKLNRAVVETDDNDKSWPIYRPVWTKFGFCPGGDFAMRQSAIHFRDPESGLSRLVKPEDPGWPEVVAKLEDWSDLLDCFRQGAEKPMIGLELHTDPNRYSDEDFQALFPNRDRNQSVDSWWFSDKDVSPEARRIAEGAIIGTMLPHLQSFRSAARTFHVDTRWAFEQNDSQRAFNNIITVLHLAQQVSREPFLIADLVGMAIHGIACNMFEEILVVDPGFFTEHQLDQLQARIESTAFQQIINWEAERDFYGDFFQRIFTDDGHGDGRITPIGMELISNFAGLKLIPDIQEFDELVAKARVAAAPISLFMIPSRKETQFSYDQYIDQFEADFKLPFWESNVLEIEKTVEETAANNPIVSALLPAYGVIRSSVDRAVAYQQADLAALAVHRYYLRYGQWPESLKQLVPEFLSEIPVDLVDGQPIRYKNDGSGPIIYSIGNDNVDDGGLPIMSANSNGNQYRPRFFPRKNDVSIENGDVILWPHSPK